MSAYLFLGLRLLAALALYAFVGFIIYLMWQNLKSQANFISSQTIRSIKLKLTDTTGAENVLEFSQPEFFIGRGADCALIIEDSLVSAKHARLSFHHGHWWIDDNGSTNGTTLNESPLVMSTILTNDDTITCGKTSIQIIQAD